MSEAAEIIEKETPSVELSDGKLSDILNNIGDEPAATVETPEDKPVDNPKPEAKKDEKPEDKPEVTPAEPATAKFTIPKNEKVKTEEKPQPETLATNTQDWKEYLKNTPREQVLKELGLDDFDIEFSKFRKNGGDPLKYIDAKAKDWSKVSDLDIIKHNIRKENDYLENDELDILVDEELKKYGIDPDASEHEKKLGSVKLKRDAHLARQKEIEEQGKFVIPTVEKQQEQGPSPAEVWKQSVIEHPATKALLQNKKVVADGGEPGYKFTFDIDDPMEIVKAQYDQETFQKYGFDDAGKPKIENENLVTLMRIAPNFVVKSLIDHGREMEKQSRLTNSQNIDKKLEVVPASTGKKTLGQAFAEDAKDMKLSDIM